jgi:hypothetical protein
VQNAPHVEELILEFQLDATLKLSGIDCFWHNWLCLNIEGSNMQRNHKKHRLYF